MHRSQASRSMGVIRMAALVGVGSRATPVLLEEHAQSFLGAREVVQGIHLTQYLVLGDLRIKAGHDRIEGLGTADSVVEGLLHLIHRLHCGASPGRQAEAGRTGSCRSPV
jgi:hypothetical protein